MRFFVCANAACQSWLGLPILRPYALKPHRLAGLAQADNDSHDADQASYAWLLLSAVLSGLLFPLTARLAGMQDGDGLLTSIISTDKLTWYFWGQDRFLNFIPALASVVQDSDLNLRTQLFLRAFFAYLAPFGILVFFDRSPRLLLLAVAITNVILVLCLNSYSLFNLYVQHNPFGTSLVLFGVAFLLLSVHDWRRWPLGLLCFLVCFLAYATNFALLLFSLPFLFFLHILRPQQRRELCVFAAINALAIGTAFTHSRIFGERSTNFSAAPSLDAVLSAAITVSENVAFVPLLLIFLVAVYCLRHVRMSYKRELVALALTACMIVVALANSAWVQSNAFNVRYFLTALILMATATSLIVSTFLLQHRLMSRRLCALMLLCGGVLLAGLHGFNRNYSELIHSRWRASAKAAAAVALRDHASLIIGDFWDVWPVVYEVHRQRSNNQPEPVFGATFRGHPMLGAVIIATVGKSTQTALCLMPTAVKCVNQARTFAQIPADIKITIKQQETLQINDQAWLKLSLTLARPAAD
ncbi:MAG: hypothetical protein ACOH2B_15240 [Burkholderiaceae bacterium]